MATEISTLVEQINEEHSRIVPRGADQLAHAIRCGELLLQAKKLVPKGHWTIWLDENVEIYRTTAFKYIRLAQHKDQVAGKFNGIDPAIEFLSGKRMLTSEEKHEIVALASVGGHSFDTIAEIMDISKSTVSYYVNAKDRNRTKQLQRTQRQQASRALEREREAKLVKRVAGQEVADAYSFVRRSEQRLQQRIDTQGIDWHEKRYLSEALHLLFQAEDRIVSALKGSEHD